MYYNLGVFLVNLNQKIALCVGLLFLGQVIMPSGSYIKNGVLGASLMANLEYFFDKNSRNFWREQHIHRGTEEALKFMNEVTHENNSLHWYGGRTALQAVALAELIEPGLGSSEDLNYKVYHCGGFLSMATANMLDEHYPTLVELIKGFNEVRQERRQQKYKNIAIVGIGSAGVTAAVYAAYKAYQWYKKGTLAKKSAEEKTITA